MQFIDLKTQYELYQSDIQQRINHVLNHGQFINGPEILEFEQALASYVGVKHAIAVSSGTDALLIAMMALNIGPGDEVITSPFTFFATVEMIVLLGAKPVFVDICPRTYNLDPSLLEAAITPKTRAIMPISLYGQCADMDAINAIANKYSIKVIEDAAQSFGATYKNKHSCNLSEIACTSFYPSKPLGCYGDGGACFTSDDGLAEKMRTIRNHGQDRTYHHVCIGLNGRLDTLQAAVMLAKLPFLEKELEARRNAATFYSECLGDKVKTPYIESFNTSVYAQYTIRIQNRDELQTYLKEKGIPTAIHYPISVNQQPAFASYINQNEHYAQAELCAREVLSLPMHPFLTKDQMIKVSDEIKNFLSL
ncbi:MAG: DegT/DnrJ/EryC1/StrS family aminotransferase [Gammaproteobacteria bacterium]